MTRRTQPATVPCFRLEYEYQGKSVCFDLEFLSLPDLIRAFQAKDQDTDICLHILDKTGNIIPGTLVLLGDLEELQQWLATMVVAARSHGW